MKTQLQGAMQRIPKAQKKENKFYCETLHTGFGMMKGKKKEKKNQKILANKDFDSPRVILNISKLLVLKLE